MQKQAPQEESAAESALDSIPIPELQAIQNGHAHDSGDLSESQTANGDSTAITKSKAKTSSKPNKQLAKVVSAPKLRPIPRSKKGASAVMRQYARNAYTMAEQNPMVAAIGAVAFVAVFVVSPVVYLTF